MFARLRLFWRMWGAYDAAKEKSGNMNGKALLSSKTFWFNLALQLIAGVQDLGLINTLPEPYGPAVVHFISGVNLLLRYVTTQPITAVASKP